MYGFYPVPEYSVGMKLWRNSDGACFDILEISTDKQKYVLARPGGAPSVFPSLELLRKNFSKEEPWAKQKAYAKEHGYVWRDKLPSE